MKNQKGKKSGRKTKLTSEIQQAICDYISKGLTKNLACKGVGIAQSTFFDWKTKGEDDRENNRHTIFSEFSEAVDRAEAGFVSTQLSHITTADDWRSRAWLLERTHPEDYGKTAMDINLGGQQGGEPIKTESNVVVYLPSNGREG